MVVGNHLGTSRRALFFLRMVWSVFFFVGRENQTCHLPDSADRKHLKQIKAETQEHHLHPHTRKRSHQHAARVKHPFNDGERPLNPAPLEVDPPVTQLLSIIQMMTPDASPYRRVEAYRLHPEVARATVVNRRRSHLHHPDEAEVGIRLHMQLKPEHRSFPHRPVAVHRSPRQSLISTRLTRWPRVRLDEAGVLGDALPHFKPFLVELPLQLRRHQAVRLRCGEAFAKLSDCRVVRRLLEEAEEVLEVDAHGGLPFQFHVAEAVPLLDDEKLHHHHLIGVGSTASGSVVSVHGFYYGVEGFPFYCCVDLCESVA